MALFAIPEDWQLKAKLRDELKPTRSATDLSVYNPYGVPEKFEDFAKLCQVRSGLEFVPFELYDYQIELSNLIDKCKGIAALKTRQMGFSELCSCKMLHESLLYPAFLGVAFSLGQAEASKLSDRVGVMPAGISGFSWQIDSKTARKSEKGGELLFRPSTPNSARSLASVTWLILDECGFPADIEEMYGNATPAQSMVGDRARRILGTTIPPEGLDCWFGQTFWKQSDLTFDLLDEIEVVKNNGGNQGPGFSYWIDDEGWARVLLHWYAHPIYCSMPNRLAKIKADEKLTEEQLQREHNLGIPKEGGSLFNYEQLEASKCDWNIESIEYGNTLTIWHQPKRNHNYIMGTDPNGKGSNNFVTQVWDITTTPFKLVAEYAEANQASLTRSIEITSDLIERYQPFRATVESNFGGVVIAENLREDNYDIQVDVVVTTARSKQVNTDRIAYELESGSFEYASDWEGVGEAKKFSALHREAASGMDDRIMAWAVTFANIEDIMEELGQPPDWIGKI